MFKTLAAAPQKQYTGAVTKQDLISMIAALPDEPETDFSGVANELEKLLIHKKISTGIREIETGQGYSQESIEESIEGWVAEFS